MLPGRLFKRRTPTIVWRLFGTNLLAVFGALVLAGLTAILMTWFQLENQIWLRVEGAQTATEAIYANELEQMNNVTALIAERPTLCQMLSASSPELAGYLRGLQEGAGFDALFVVRSNGDVTGVRAVGLPPIADLMARQDLPFVDFVASENLPRLFIVAMRDVPSKPECYPANTRLVAARMLDDEFLQTLAEQTGIEQSLIVEDIRTATSFNIMPGWSPDADTARSIIHNGEDCCTTDTATRGEIYYVMQSALHTQDGNTAAISEVALPARTIRNKIWLTLGIFLGIGLFVGVLALLLVTRQNRHITQPLEHLSEAANHLGKGNLDTPIVSTSRLREFEELTNRLDLARRRLRRTWHAYRREQRRLQHLLEVTSEGVIICDTAGRVVAMNEKVERLLGHEARNMLYENYTQLFRPLPGQPGINQILYPQPGTPPMHQIGVYGKNDRPLTLEVSTTKLVKDGDPLAPYERAIVIRDVSEAAALEHLRSTFLANVSHEFRTPLSSVIAISEILEEEGPDLSPEDLTQLAETIRVGTLNLKNLVNNLLQSASMEAGHFRVKPVPIHMEDIIDDAVKTMNPLLNRQAQTLTTHTPPQLPAMSLDPAFMLLVFVNLLANASKFSPTGASIEIHVRQKKSTLTVSVLDTGPGLPASRFSDLFERFVTGEFAPDSEYGVGLGLSVVKQIIGAHGGQVGAQNRPEGGANVWFTLPITKPDQDDPAIVK